MQDPVTVFAIIEVPDADIKQVNVAVSELARLSILEADCLRYDVYQSRNHPVRLIIQELWADDSALERHRGSSHVKNFKTALSGTGTQIWAGQCGLLE
jgi:quinol monooxygenase YgiN